MVPVMPGRRISDAQRQSYIAYRARGLRQSEVLKITGVSRQTGVRIEKTAEYRKAVLDYEPVVPGRPHPELERTMPEEVALKLLNGLRNARDPQAIIAATRGVIDERILDDLERQLSGDDLPRPAPEEAAQAEPEPEDSEGADLYGDLSTEYLPQSLGHNRLPKRTFSLNDRSLGPVFPEHALAALRKPKGPSRGLTFWES
jgi:DNA-binding XRE family transcriptional regulator